MINITIDKEYGLCTLLCKLFGANQPSNVQVVNILVMKYILR